MSRRDAARAHPSPSSRGCAPGPAAMAGGPGPSHLGGARLGDARLGDSGLEECIEETGSGDGQSRSCLPPDADRPPPPPLDAPPVEAGGGPSSSAVPSEVSSAAMPSASLSGAPDARSRQALAVLRQTLEAQALRKAGPEVAGAPAWRLGAPEVDALLSSAGLEAGGVHEIKVAAAQDGDERGARGRAGRHGGPARPRGPGVRAEDRAAAAFFALTLARRRLGAAGSGGIGPPAILWCEPRREAAEIGRLYAPGVARLGIPPERLIMVATPRPEETLWAAEEGLRSGVLALVVAVLDGGALTPARRLALAAERWRTPCLLLAGPHAPAAATATRWRVARAPSAAHAFAPRAPGASRISVTLERCRAKPLAAERPFVLEWSDASYRFDMVSGVGDRAHAGGGAPRVSTVPTGVPTAPPTGAAGGVFSGWGVAAASARRSA